MWRPAGKVLPPTDDQIQDFITERLNYLKTLESNNADHPHHSTTSASDKKERPAIPRAEQRTAEVGRAHQKNSSKGSNANAEFTVKSKDTEYPQIMAKVAATCTKNEDKSPLVVPTNVNCTKM
ncbi:hypothetical protein INR49_002130 [Caranx melampygus]|nr:hypothetical protein INR49_002130 [Caranx melampygus]